MESVFQVIDGHDEGIEYFVDQLETNLAKFHHANKPPAHVTNEHKLLGVGRKICEDLCILRKINGEWILIAGLVAFPSRWDIREKIGLNIDQIHAPVPSYSETLQPLLSDTFDRLKPSRPAWRRNWSLHATSKLHEPRYGGEKARVEDFWWRTERQTLTKSPDGEYILFTIRNRAEPLAWIKEDPEAARAFAQTLESLSPSMLEYKRIVEERAQLLAYLRS